MLRTWKMRDGESGRAAGAFQFERLAVKVTPWRVILAGVGVGAYALGLIAMLPPEAVAGNDRDMVGSVWNGEAALGSGFAAGWSTRPLSSITNLGLAEDVTVRGPQTDVVGEAIIQPGRVLVRDLNGLASARLLNAMVPGLPFVCDSDLNLAVGELALKGRPAGEGSIRSSAGTCTGAGGQGGATSAAALTGTFGGDGEATSVVLTRTGQTEPLARARVSPDGAATLTVEPAGVGVLPGLSAPVTIETTL